MEYVLVIVYFLSGGHKFETVPGFRTKGDCDAFATEMKAVEPNNPLRWGDETLEHFEWRCIKRRTLSPRETKEKDNG